MRILTIIGLILTVGALYFFSQAARNLIGPYEDPYDWGA